MRKPREKISTDFRVNISSILFLYTNTKNIMHLEKQKYSEKKDLQIAKI